MERDASYKLKPEESWSGYTAADKIDFKTKIVPRGKEVDCIMVKWSIHHEDITIIRHMELTTELPNTTNKTGRNKRRSR